jgi:hypothetical protein
MSIRRIIIEQWHVRRSRRIAFPGEPLMFKECSNLSKSIVGAVRSELGEQYPDLWCSIVRGTWTGHVGPEYTAAVIGVTQRMTGCCALDEEKDVFAPMNGFCLVGETRPLLWMRLTCSSRAVSVSVGNTRFFTASSTAKRQRSRRQIPEFLQQTTATHNETRVIPRFSPCTLNADRCALSGNRKGVPRVAVGFTPDRHHVQDQRERFVRLLLFVNSIGRPSNLIGGRRLVRIPRNGFFSDQARRQSRYWERRVVTTIVSVEGVGGQRARDNDVRMWRKIPQILVGRRQGPIVCHHEGSAKRRWNAVTLRFPVPPLEARLILVKIKVTCPLRCWTNCAPSSTLEIPEYHSDTHLPPAHSKHPREVGTNMFRLPQTFHRNSNYPCPPNIATSISHRIPPKDATSVRTPSDPASIWTLCPSTRSVRTVADSYATAPCWVQSSTSVLFSCWPPTSPTKRSYCPMSSPMPPRRAHALASPASSRHR